MNEWVFVNNFDVKKLLHNIKVKTYWKIIRNQHQSIPQGRLLLPMRNT